MSSILLSVRIRPPPRPTLFPYTTLFRSLEGGAAAAAFASGSAATSAVLLALQPGDHVIAPTRSEEHTSELQSHSDLVCRLLLEKKKIEERDHPELRAAHAAYPIMIDDHA